MAKRKSQDGGANLPKAAKRDWRYWVRLITGDNVSGLVKLLIAFLIVSWLVVQQFSIPSGSMEPTLHGDPRFLRGDRVLVNKWLYGIRVPFTNTRIFDYKDPERWDIVVFHSVEEDAEHGVLIKRVVGLPGEHVLIGDDGRIRINGEPVDPPEELRGTLHYTRSLTPPEEMEKYYVVLLAVSTSPAGMRDLPEEIVRDFQTIRQRLQERGIDNLKEFNDLAVAEREKISEGLSGVTMEYARRQLAMDYNTQVSREKPFRYGIVDEPQYTVVPEGHYFVLGDNSGNSVDGRFFGWLPKGNILGKATSIWWPFTRARDFTGWTDRWWGKLIVYGIPALWIGYEICVAFFFCSWRVRRSELSPLQPGDHVWVNRIALGLRVPFMSRRITGGREIRDGEYILTRAPEGVLDGFIVARVTRGKSKKDGDGIPVTVDDEGKSVYRVPREYIVGTVSSVWLPLRRRVKLDASSAE